jgi:hypothetical protein
MADQPNILHTSADPDYGIDFPISLYERPMLAMSNLLLRGDVDAATRSLFAPQTLSPNEMQTITRRIAGPRPGKLVKTVLDVVTNPLVIMGVVGGYLLWPAAGTEALAALYQGVKRAVPECGLLGRWVGGGLTRLRHLVTEGGESMMGAIADLTGEMAHYMEADRNLRVAAYGDALGDGARAGGVQGHQVAMQLKGWNRVVDEDLKKYGIDYIMAPGLQGKLAETPEVISAADKTRNYLDGIKNAMLKDPKIRAQLTAAAEERGLTLGPSLENYWPEMVTPNELQRKVMRWSGDVKARVGLARDYEARMSDNLLAKSGRAVPDLEEMRLHEARGEIVAGTADRIQAGIDADISRFRYDLAGTMQKYGPQRAAIDKALAELTEDLPTPAHILDSAGERLFGAVTGVSNESIPEAIDYAAKLIRTPGTYSMDLDPVLTRYGARMAKTHAWFLAPSSTPGLSLGGKITNLQQTFKDLGTMHSGDYADQYLNEQLLPMILGQKTPRMYARSDLWAWWRQARAGFLKSPIAEKYIPGDARQFMIKNLEDLHSLDIEQVGHGINEYMYLATMGSNLGPATKNIWQNPLTFVNLPGMGWGTWARGIGETFKRAAAYLADAPTMGARPAFEKHFSDFIEASGPTAGVLDKMFGIEHSVGAAATENPSVLKKVEDVMMAPFKFTELWVNRMTSFYGARAKGLAWGKTVAEANRMAGNVVDLSHFTGGPAGMPAGIMDWWAPWRQFMQFPSRLIDFMGASTRMGANPNRLDFGTISRMVAASAGAYTVGKDLLGTDLSQGLLAGALPLPQYSNAPFFPFPLVPPLAQMAGNIAKGINTGTAQPFADTATMLIPGGIAARRLVKTLGPKHADYDNRTPDGRVPVYNDQGGLIGAYSPLQLGMRALGMMPADAAAERGAAEWLVKQRDQIRGYRQQWLQAQMENDPVAADKVQRQFQKRYPELGPMQFHKSDINAIQQRRDTARIDRIMRGFPKEYKPLFQNIVDEAQLGAFTQGAPAQPLPAGLQALQ